MSKTYDAALWRQRAAQMAANSADAEDLKLPSGMVIRAVRPDVRMWILHGRMPASLVAAVRAAKDAPAAPDPTDEEIEAFGRFYYDLIVATVVRPRIVAATPGDGEIGYTEIPPEDLDFIWKWATRHEEVAGVAGFRGVERDAGAGDHGKDVRPAAKRARRNRG